MNLESVCKRDVTLTLTLTSCTLFSRKCNILLVFCLRYTLTQYSLSIYCYLSILSFCNVKCLSFFFFFYKRRRLGKPLTDIHYVWHTGNETLNDTRRCVESHINLRCLEAPPLPLNPTPSQLFTKLNRACLIWNKTSQCVMVEVTTHGQLYQYLHVD